MPSAPSCICSQRPRKKQLSSPALWRTRSTTGLLGSHRRPIPNHPVFETHVKQEPRFSIFQTPKSYQPAFEKPAAQIELTMRHAGIAIGDAFGRWAFELFSAMKGNNSTAMNQLQELLGSRPNSSVRGWAFEIEHARTYNADAISKGLPFRAESLGVDSQSPADIRIVNIDVNIVVKEIQCKVSDNAARVRRDLAHPKYQGRKRSRQKVLRTKCLELKIRLS